MKQDQVHHLALISLPPDQRTRNFFYSFPKIRRMETHHLDARFLGKQLPSKYPWATLVLPVKVRVPSTPSQAAGAVHAWCSWLGCQLAWRGVGKPSNFSPSLQHVG